MKRFFAFLMFLMFLMFLPVVSLAVEPEVYSRTDAVTTGTVSVAAAAFSSVDVKGTLGLSDAAWTQITNQGGPVLEVRAMDDGNSVTVSLVAVKQFATEPSSGDLDESTPAKSGVALEEGDRLVVKGPYRYLGFHGVTGTSKVRVVRRE